MTHSSGYTITNNSPGKISIEGNSALTGNFTNKVIVRWVTAAEINNDYFTVERSADGIRFEPAGRLSLSLFAPEATIVRVEVLDATGRVLYASEEVTDKGTSSLALDVSFLSPGLYFVKISHEGGTDSRRLIRN